MSFVTCACGTRNSAFNPRCMACGAPIAEAPARPRAPPIVAPSSAQSVEGTRFGSWIVRALIGRGSAGDVFLAIHETTGEKAALKVLSGPGAPAPTARRRFLREASVLRLVRHAHLARILDLSDSEEKPWLALEYFDGPTLEQLLLGGALDRPVALSILAQVAEALDAVHSAGIIHRDVKPANVVLASPPPNPDARLIDLGLARSLDRSLDSLRTEAGIVIGSLTYAAPEVVMGETATPASDLWSLGVMAFELVCGRLPFSGSTRAQLAASIVNSPVPDITGPGAEQIRAMLERDPENRPKDARGLALLLRREMQTAAPGS